MCVRRRRRFPPLPPFPDLCKREIKSPTGDGNQNKQKKAGKNELDINMNTLLQSSCRIPFQRPRLLPFPSSCSLHCIFEQPLFSRLKEKGERGRGGAAPSLPPPLSKDESGLLLNLLFFLRRDPNFSFFVRENRKRKRADGRAEREREERPPPHLAHFPFPSSLSEDHSPISLPPFPIYCTLRQIQIF